MRCALEESSCLGMQLKSGGKSHLKLNIGERPIANKYREGKMQRTLKRELKVLEIVKREAIGTSVLRAAESAARRRSVLHGEGSVGLRLCGAGRRRAVHFGRARVSVDWE